ncbi:MAG: helix-turn-helix domain-containing protein [Fimbriiglobus sp.]
MTTIATDDPLILSVPEVVKLLGLSRSTVVRLADAGRIRCVKLQASGKETIRKFRPSWVREFLDAHTTGGQP